MVFVLDTNKRPLAPCHEAVARKLLKQGKAAIYKRYPFTIILKEIVDNFRPKTPYRLKIDYGSKHTGLAIVRGQEVVWLGQLDHRTDIKERLDKRRAFRRARRKRKTRYRKPRFLNRRRKDGWLPPSLESRVQNIQTWVERLRKICPIEHISYENAKFDTQLMRNPEINGVEYQQGTLQGYEVREYLLEKFGRKCCYCGKEGVPLEIEHTIPKSRGGTDRVDNLCLACHDCNQRKGSKTAEEFGYPHIQEMVKKTLKDASVVNATRWKVYEVLKQSGCEVECGTGARTKMNRIRLGLPKIHYFDACCVGESTLLQLHFKTKEALFIKAKGRGSRSRTNLDKYGFPRGFLARQKYFFCFQTGDIVKANVPKGKYQGVWFGEVACRKNGSFDMKDKDGKRIAQGISYKYFNIIQRFDGYTYRREGMNIA
ncbi:RNA-guided endonuclease IscB [Anoxybacillus flavithermus]|nr:RNA-guided endonuclease IscB [Anoxybacillus flavithermus]MBE2928877.1 HNH endonuclease [Anoxybacillus flavithermus]MBE2955794.1 HNH endonuclease [Anoxybacillus flavithermus]